MAKEKEDSERMRQHYRKRGAGGLLLGIFLLAIGVSWLGNDLSWWSFNLPWAPLALVLFSISLILGGVWRHM